MKTFILNLPKDVTRKNQIEHQVKTLKMSYQFIEGIDGRQLSEAELNKSVDPKFRHLLLPGEIGCALSHMKAYQEVVSQNLEQALVIEDDSLLDSQLPRLLSIIKTSKRPEVILLTTPDRIIKNNSKKIDNQFSQYKVLSTLGAYGYIINNAAAKTLIKHCTPVWHHADNWILFQKMGLIDLCAIEPILIHPSELNEQTTICKQSDRDELFKQHKDLAQKQITIFLKLKYALWRLFILPFLQQKKFSGTINNNK